MTLLNKSQLKYIVAHMPENRLKKRLKIQKNEKKKLNLTQVFQKIV